MIQWLKLGTPNAGGMGSVLGQGTKVQNAAWCGDDNNAPVISFSSFLV